jgi:hypothetical protein
MSHPIYPVCRTSFDSPDYMAPGKVLEVYDTNSSGVLLPVRFTPVTDQPNHFYLAYSPYGRIYAMIEGETK